MAVQLISNIWDKVKTNYSYTSSYRKQVRETDEDIQNMQEGISGFRKIIRTLRNYSPNTITKDKLEKNLESFVKEYNELKKDSKNIENKDIRKELSKMDELISENKKELKKIGIKVSDDELKFDSEIFKDAKDKEINRLFEGNDSFINKIYKTMRNVNKIADESEYQLEYKQFSQTTKYDKTTIDALKTSNEVPCIIDFQGTVSALTALSSTEDKAKISEYLTKFAQSYNSFKDMCDEKSIELNMIISGFNANKNDLANLGLNLDADNTVSFTQSAINNDNFAKSYDALFNKKSEFVKVINDSCNTIFNNLISPVKQEDTIINQQV